MASEKCEISKWNIFFLLHSLHSLALSANIQSLTDLALNAVQSFVLSWKQPSMLLRLVIKFCCLTIQWIRKVFSIFQYSGAWFEIGRYQQRDEPEADCLSSSYSWGFISRSFQINRNGFDFVTEEFFVRQATALLAFPDASPTLGLLNVTYYADRGKGLLTISLSFFHYVL